MNRPAINLLFVSDHILVRTGLRLLLQTLDGVHSVVEANNVADAITRLSCNRTDLLLLDLDLPDCTRLSELRALVDQFPELPILVLSLCVEEAPVRQALAAGVAGYLIKDAGPEELDLAIRSLAAGQSYFSPAVARHAAAGPADTASLAALTPRQCEILEMLADGATTQKAAQCLGISVKTVETHRLHLMNRLGIHDLPGLVRFAIRTGLIRVHP